MSKEAIRKQLMIRRKNIVDDKKSNAIIQKLIQTQEYNQAKRIMFYHSLPVEVNTRELIQEELLKKEKIILLPYCLNDMDMGASEIKEVSGLAKGPFNVYEPKDKIENNKPIDLIIIPGVGFDLHGNRIGFGKGYYDKFLSSNPGSKTIGLIFDELIIDSLPTEPHDKGVDMVITEERIIRCS